MGEDSNVLVAMLAGQGRTARPYALGSADTGSLRVAEADVAGVGGLLNHSAFIHEPTTPTAQ
jgi:hypothetical protein